MTDVNGEKMVVEIPFNITNYQHKVFGNRDVWLHLSRSYSNTLNAEFEVVLEKTKVKKIQRNKTKKNTPPEQMTKENNQEKSRENKSKTVVAQRSWD